MTSFTLRNPEVLENCVAHIRGLSPEKIWDVEIKKHSKKRSNPQNRYWHKLVGILASEIGNSPEDMKDILKDRFLGYDVLHFEGREIRRLKSSSKLDTADMAELITKTLALGMSLNIRMPAADYYGDQ